ncbi:MAG: tetratricopeptide repeat protein [bacterium]|nr:tetratricopeptide repeat protein [bacterium]
MQKQIDKIISTTIDLKDFKQDLQLNDRPISDNEKQSLISKFLDLPENYRDSIDFTIKEEKLSFHWKIPKLNQDAEEYHRKAILQAKSADFDQAIKSWKAAIEIDPYNPNYFFNLGVACFEKKQYTDAIESLMRTILICPIYARAYLILGMSYLKIRNFNEAKTYLEKSLKFQKSNEITYLNLGAIYSILKDYQNGLKMFEKVISLSPKDPRAYMGIAKIYTALGNSNQANNYLKKVIQFDKKGNLGNYAKRLLTSTSQDSQFDSLPKEEYENTEEYYSRGYKYFLLSDFNKAAQFYKKYLSIKPDDDYVWSSLGDAQLRSGDVLGAVESFKKAAKLSPQKGLYFKQLGIAFYYLKDHEKVIAAVSKAKKMGKTDSITYCIWGKALLELGNINEAMIMLDHSLKTNRNNLLSKYFMAIALSQQKEFQDALGFLDEIINSKIYTPLIKLAEKLKNEIMEKPRL